jgi:hypothetical protein
MNQKTERRINMRDAPPQGTYKVQAFDRAFAVLDLAWRKRYAAGSGAGGRFAATAQEHRAPLFHGSGTASHGGADRATASSAWDLRLFDFGNRAIEQYDLRERAQPHLRRLVAETEETAHLAYCWRRRA